MLQPLHHHIAEFNVGRIKYELTDPRMGEFIGNLELVNGIAERSPGFVWRYVDDSSRGGTTTARPFSDRRLIVNLSVWETVAALEHYVWQTVHKRFYGRRTDWFDHFEGPAVTLWWIPVAHRPNLTEAVQRFTHLQQHGPSDYAFDWQRAAAQLWKTARCAPSGEVA